MQNSTAVQTFRPLSLMAFCLMPVAAVAQATINVPRDQPTIQAAINAANDGDTVLIAPGKYVENINFEGKAITVTSAGGAANTILDGGAVGPTVTFAYGEPRAAVLSGLTIQNGGGFGSNNTALGIAGVLINSSSPTILNNIITQNQCRDIEILYGGPLIQGNTISSTQTPSGGCGAGSGAGIYVNGNLNGDPGTDDGSAAIITGNTIENITMPATAGASPGSSNVYTENGGAGIAVFDGSPLIENNILRNNSAPGGNGGAINIAGGSGATIVQNLIYGNSAGCGGGALAFSVFDGPGTDLLVANNTIVDNTGGSADPFASCGNAAQIYATNFGFSTPNVVFVNNIVSGNTAAATIGCPTLPVVPSEANQSIFDHNLFYNAGGRVFGPSCVDVAAKYGNLPAAPQFANVAQGDYHLLAASPGIDAGNNSVLGNLSSLSGTNLVTDFDGTVRVQDATRKGVPIIDMGAYELAGVVDGSVTTIVLTASTYAGTPGDPLSLSAFAASPLGVPTGSITFFLDGQKLGVSPISSGGNASFYSVIPPAGTHSLYAAYPGTGQGQASFLAANSVIIIVTAEGPPASKTYTTSLQVGVNFNPQTVGQPEAITVFGSSNDPNSAFSPSPITLTVNNGTVLASLTPISQGISRFTTSTLPIGLDTITATYAGDATHQASTASTTVDILGIGTSLVLQCSPNNPRTIQVGQTESLSATVSTRDGSTPSGSVVLSDDGVVFADIPLVNGMANWAYVGRTTGDHFVEAYYGASGPDASAGSVLCYVPPGPPPPPPPFPPTPYILVLGLDSKSVLTVNPSTLPFDSTTSLTATVSPANPPGVGTPTGTVTFFDGTTLLGTANLVNGVATFSTYALPLGGSSLTCTYEGDSHYGPSNCNTVPVTTLRSQPTLAITASANPIPAFTPVTFLIKLSENGNLPPPGLTVQLSLNNQTVSLPLDPDGEVTYTVSNLAPGTYPVTVTFAGDAGFSSASASLTETVTGNSSTTSLSAAPNPGYVGQLVTLSALVTAPNTLVPVGGSVTFYDGNTPLGTQTFGQYRTATLTTSSLALGVHLLTAVYAGDNGFAGSTSQVVTETILASSGSASTTTLSASPNPAGLGQPVTLSAAVTAVGAMVPTGGSVAFLDGTTLLGMGTLGQNRTATLTTSSLALGVHSLTAVYAGDNGFAGSTSQVVTETILASGGSASTTSLSASPNPAGVGQPVTLSAAVTAAGTTVPTGGSVNFYDGTILLGTGTLGQNRTVTLTTSSLAPGVHSLTAVYAGDIGLAGSTSQVVNETISSLSSSFTLSLSPSSLTGPANQTSTVAVQLASVGTFAGPLTLSYSALPLYASASFVPPVVTLTSGGAGSSTLTLKAALPKLVAANHSPLSPVSPRGPGSPALLAAALLLLLGGRGRRRALRLGLRTRQVLWMALTAALLQTVTGCGNDYSFTIPAVAPGTYQIQITATDVNQNKQTAVLTWVVTAQ